MEHEKNIEHATHMGHRNNMKPIQTHEIYNLDMQPMQRTNANTTKHATNAGRRPRVTNAGRPAGGTNVGERADGQIWERVNFSRKKRATDSFPVCFWGWKSSRALHRMRCYCTSREGLITYVASSWVWIF